jgi:putative flippase GtrA
MPLSAAFLKQGTLFVMLSGAGWLLDLFAFGALVTIGGVGAGLANVISASLGAMTVYAVARAGIFLSPRTDRSDVLAYLLYTVASILVWAYCIDALAGVLGQQPALEQQGYAALAAKIIVTPMSLITNFVVARFLAGARTPD